MIRNLSCQINKLQLLHLFTTRKLVELFDSSQKGGMTPVIANVDEVMVILGPSRRYLNDHGESGYRRHKAKDRDLG